MRLSCMPCIAILLVLAVTPVMATPGSEIQVAERLQRNQSGPPADTGAAPHRGDSGSQGHRPEHSREPGRPEHSRDPGRPEHSRQERSRELREERPQHPDNRPDESSDPDSRWNTHGAPEPDTGESDDDGDDGRIYFERYP